MLWAQQRSLLIAAELDSEGALRFGQVRLPIAEAFESAGRILHEGGIPAGRIRCCCPTSTRLRLHSKATAPPWRRSAPRQAASQTLTPLWRWRPPRRPPTPPGSTKSRHRISTSQKRSHPTSVEAMHTRLASPRALHRTEGPVSIPALACRPCLHRRTVGCPHANEDG